MATDNLPIPAELALPDEPFDVDLLDEALASHGAYAPDAPPEAAEYLPEPVRRWRITDDGAAEWAMRRLAEAEQTMRAIGVQAAEWRERISDWEAKVRKPWANRQAFFAAHLEQYGLATRAATGAKSIPLPSGTVSTRSSSPKVVVDDADALVAWAKSVPWVNDADEKVTLAEAFVRVIEEPMLTEMRKHVTVAEVPDVARMVWSCGCVVWSARSDRDELLLAEHEMYRQDERVIATFPELGEAVRCIPCEQDALVGKVNVLRSHYEAHGPSGEPVPGCSVQLGGVTPSVRPA